jgi:hypothetical protein
MQINHSFAYGIPPILLFLFLSHRQAFMEFSHGILGKLISVCIIVFYTLIDYYLGLFVCLLILFYYQTDVMENMLNVSLKDTGIHSFPFASLNMYDETPKSDPPEQNQVNREFQQEYCI